MKKLAMLFIFVLACSVSAFAGPQDKAAEESSRGERAGKKVTMVGCIYQQGDKLLLMSYKQSGGVELQGSEDLKSHVGHKVKVHGTMLNEPAHAHAAREESNADDRVKQEKHVVSHEPENGPLQVNKIEMISEKCDKTYRKSAEKELDKTNP